MIVERDVAVPMRDGAVLRADIFRLENLAQSPVLMTFGPYGKDVPLRQFMPAAWDMLQGGYADILNESSGRWLVWETPDPEAWVPHGYAVVRVDARGAGQSPGRLDPNSPAEFRDFYDAIEWAGTQPWSNGRVGLTGISYHAAGQWQVAALNPPHLKALLPWQGTYDFYRDRTRQDGIFGSGFVRRWWERSVLRNQHGNAASPYTGIHDGSRTTGPASLSPQELSANRADYVADILAHPLNDAWYRERTPDLSAIRHPTLVVANWGGLGLHLRGTIGGYVGIASTQKWLKVQSGSYIHTYLQPHNVALQRRFFDRYLKDVDNGWEREPPVEVDIRGPADDVRAVVQGMTWPLPQTRWMRLFLDADAASLAAAPACAASVSYPALGPGVTFMTAPLPCDTTFAGPAALTVHVASTTADMDLFVTLRAFDAQNHEITFRSFIESQAPVSQGWLRLSQRRLTQAHSADGQPVHSHDQHDPLVPGQVYAANVAIWPMSLWLPQGARLALTIQGQDFRRSDGSGIGWMTHDDPIDRPLDLFGGAHTLHTGGARASSLLLPVI